MISFTFATSGSDFYMRNSWIFVYTAFVKNLLIEKVNLSLDAMLACIARKKLEKMHVQEW